MKRYKFRAPWNFDQIDVVNGESIRRLTIWAMGLDRKESDADAVDIPSVFLHDILGYFGIGSILQIDKFRGIVERPQETPAGWTYRNGESLEPSWFYKWRLFPSSRLMLEADLQELSMLRYPPNHLKDLAPINLYNERAKNAIPVMQLPELFKGKDWTIYTRQN